jgi:hypothetical protein
MDTPTDSTPRRVGFPRAWATRVLFGGLVHLREQGLEIHPVNQIKSPKPDRRNDGYSSRSASWRVCLYELAIRMFATPKRK